MNRRALLAATSTAAASLAGCLGGFAGSDDYEWRYDVGGRVEAVSEGQLFFQEDFTNDGEGSVVALDADDGDRLWSYGSVGGYSAYTNLTVADAVYFGLGDDAIGSGTGELYAIERDGTERWTADTGSVYERPRLREGVLYVGSDDGVVRAFDAADGEVRWRYEVEPDESGPPNPAVTAVDEECVYVESGRLLALDRSGGELRWQFGAIEYGARDVAVLDGVVYVVGGTSVHAVEGGEELWSKPFESTTRVLVDDGRVFVRSGSALLRFDPREGTERWSVDVAEPGDWRLHRDRVYAAGDRLHAVDADAGETLWSESVGDGDSIERLQVVGDGDDHSVIVANGGSGLYELASNGEVTWSETVEGDVRGLAVEGLVYVGTSEGIYALARE